MALLCAIRAESYTATPQCHAELKAPACTDGDRRLLPGRFRSGSSVRKPSLTSHQLQVHRQTKNKGAHTPNVSSFPPPRHHLPPIESAVTQIITTTKPAAHYPHLHLPRTVGIDSASKYASQYKRNKKTHAPDLRRASRARRTCGHPRKGRLCST